MTEVSEAYARWCRGEKVLRPGRQCPYRRVDEDSAYRFRVQVWHPKGYYVSNWIACDMDRYSKRPADELGSGDGWVRWWQCHDGQKSYFEARGPFEIVWRPLDQVAT